MPKALTHKLKQAPGKHKSASQPLQPVLSKENACYVLITCGQPSADGKMEVEMTYEGDACLAAYLIESALEFIGETAPS